MTKKELQEIEDYWADCSAEDDIYRLVAEVRNIKSEAEALRAVNKNLADLVQQVMDDHANPDSGFHNECDVSPCMWCAGAAAIIAAAKDGK